MEYYVYAYLDPRKPGKYVYGNLEFDYLPFYVGKGKGNRMLDHLNEKTISNPYKTRIITKIQESDLYPIIIKIKENLSDKESINIEMETIAKIGRSNINNGPLTNLTNGGDGTSGWIQSDVTKEQRCKTLFEQNSKWRNSVSSKEFSKKMSEVSHFNNEDFKKNLSVKYTGTGNPMYGKQNSDKQKEAVKKAHIEGKIKLTEDGRKKIIEANNRRKGYKLNAKRKDSVTYVITSPYMEIYTILGAKELQEFCKFQKLQYHALKNNSGKIITKNEITGVRITAKNTIGWRLERN
jgi:hypothetical protein